MFYEAIGRKEKNRLHVREGIPLTTQTSSGLAV